MISHQAKKATKDRPAIDERRFAIGATILRIAARLSMMLALCKLSTMAITRQVTPGSSFTFYMGCLACFLFKRA
jgi:hypothetical protein